MPDKDISRITGYHAHVYFDAATKDTARGICEAAKDLFGAEMGRMHDNPVGPHPEPSCQLAVSTERFADVIAWLALNRDGLTIFVHPVTGDDLADHRDHAIWLGAMPKLNLSLFEAD